MLCLFNLGFTNMVEVKILEFINSQLVQSKAIKCKTAQEKHDFGYDLFEKDGFVSIVEEGDVSMYRLEVSTPRVELYESFIIAYDDGVAHCSPYTFYNHLSAYPDILGGKRKPTSEMTDKDGEILKSLEKGPTPVSKYWGHRIGVFEHSNNVFTKIIKTANHGTFYSYIKKLETHRRTEGRAYDFFCFFSRCWMPVEENK
jgi:hypothetical protein